MRRPIRRSPSCPRRLPIMPASATASRLCSLTTAWPIARAPSHGPASNSACNTDSHALTRCAPTASRTLHPGRAQRMGLRAYLPELKPTQRGIELLAASVQLASSPCQPWSVAPISRTQLDDNNLFRLHRLQSQMLYVPGWLIDETRPVELMEIKRSLSCSGCEVSPRSIFTA